MPDKRHFYWKPLGGLGEVGMNCMLLGFGDVVLPIDCGLMFADTNNYGIEAVFPDFEALFTKHQISNWLITHAHEDHIGAIPHALAIAKKLGVAPPQFWAPPFAKALICEKLKDSKFPGLSQYTELIHEVPLNENIDIEGIDVRFIEIRHSTVDCCSLAFRAEIDGNPINIFHSADLKIDFNEFEDGIKALDIFNVFGGERPDLMFLDSTNADRKGQSVSEKEILDPLDRLIKEAPQRIFITLFSSNVYRIAALLNLAEKNGKKAAIVGRSMQTAYRVAKEIGAFDKMPKFSESTLVSPEILSQLPAEKQMIIGSGSQGEHRSFLSKLAADAHPDFVVQPEDTVLFSSKVIPGNEKAIGRLVNSLMRIGARVLWADIAKEAAAGPVHASGHGRQSELETLLDYLKPKTLIPVHGQRYHLEACAAIAKETSATWPFPLEIFLQENNDELQFVNHDSRWILDQKVLGDPYQSKYLRFDRFLCPSRDPFLIERKRAASGGCVSAFLESAGHIQVHCRGVFPKDLQAQSPYSDLPDEVEIFLRNQLRRHKANKHNAQLAHELEDELGKFLKRLLGYRPLVIVAIEGT